MIRHGILATLFSLVVMGTSQPAWAADSQPATVPTSPAAIKDLVEQLGDASFKVRQAAQRQLIEVGEPALQAVAAAARSDDSEVRARAEAILPEIRRNVRLARSEVIRKDLVWSFPVPGGATHGAVVVGGNVYVGGDNMVYAVDLRTGKSVWNRMGTSGGKSLACDDFVLVFHGGTTYVIDPATGKMKKYYDGPPGSVLADGVLYGLGERTLLAQDPTTGRRKWEAGPRKGASLVDHSVVGEGIMATALHDGHEDNNGGIAVLDLADGKWLWSAKPAEASCAGLAIDKGLVYCQAANTLYAYRAKTGELTWQHALPGGAATFIRIKIHPGAKMWTGNTAARPMVVADGLAIVATGDQLLAVNSATGKKAWQYMVETQGSAPAGDRADPNGGGAAAVQLGGGVQAQFLVGLNGAAPPACESIRPTGLVVADGVIYVGSNAGLTAVDIKTGSTLWQFGSIGAIVGNPVFADGILYFATSRTVAFPPAGNAPPESQSVGLHALRLRPSSVDGQASPPRPTPSSSDHRQ